MYWTWNDHYVETYPARRMDCVMWIWLIMQVDNVIYVLDQRSLTAKNEYNTQIQDPVIVFYSIFVINESSLKSLCRKCLVMATIQDKIWTRRRRIIFQQGSSQDQCRQLHKHHHPKKNQADLLDSNLDVVSWHMTIWIHQHKMKMIIVARKKKIISLGYAMWIMQIGMWYATMSMCAAIQRGRSLSEMMRNVISVADGADERERHECEVIIGYYCECFIVTGIMRYYEWITLSYVRGGTMVYLVCREYSASNNHAHGSYVNLTPQLFDLLPQQEHCISTHA